MNDNILKNCILLLEETLNNMPTDQADAIVRGTVIILKTLPKNRMAVRQN